MKFTDDEKQELKRVAFIATALLVLFGGWYVLVAIQLMLNGGFKD